MKTKKSPSAALQSLFFQGEVPGSGGSCRCSGPHVLPYGTHILPTGNSGQEKRLQLVLFIQD